MGYVDVTGVRHTLPDGRVLLDDVGFRVGEGACAALVGENGAGKTTLLRIISGDLTPEAGSVARTGGLGGMRPVIGSGGGRCGEHTAGLQARQNTVLRLLLGKKK